MPAHLVADDLAAGRLVRLRIEGEEDGYDYSCNLIHRTDMPPGRAGAWLQDALESACTGELAGVRRG